MTEVVENSNRGDEIKVLSLEEALAMNGVSVFQLRLLLICGCALASDAMEINLLSFLSICAAEEWGLDQNEEAGYSGYSFCGDCDRYVYSSVIE